MLRSLIYHRAVQRLNNLYWEAYLDISTRGIAKVDRSDSCHYASINYSIVHKILSHLDLKLTDTFVDVGSGKGRVICCAARHACNNVVGIEYSEEFCKAAKENIKRLRSIKAPVHIHNGLAENFDYRGSTILYLFNPFGHKTLEAVLQKVEDDIQESPIRIVFVNPSKEHMSVFTKHIWLEQYDHWDVDRGRGHSVAFYQRKNSS
jgi:precorrin-6B methylase 2